MLTLFWKLWLTIFVVFWIAFIIYENMDNFDFGVVFVEFVCWLSGGFLIGSLITKLLIFIWSC